VTLGADYRAQKNLVLGAAFGALLGDTTLTGGSQKTKGYSASVFGQWLPSDHWYVNSIVNLGTNRIDNSRTSVSGETLTGRGTTTQQAFQVETGYGLSKDGARFTPFVRYEMIRAKLKPFEERGGMDALAISGQTVRANTFGLGAVAEYAISTSNGVWIPSGRVEFLSESQKQNAAFARLVNGTPVLAPLSVDAIDKSYGTWGLNLQWLAGPGGNLISSFIGYEQTFGKTGFKSDRFTAGVKIPF
jgi:outer membrane autotransporter protein